MRTFFIWWFIIWVVVAGVVMLFAKQPSVLYGVGVAALISLVLMVKMLSEAWTGEIVQVRTERVDVSGGDGDPLYQDVDFAYVRLASGKVKKMRSAIGWLPGMKLEKRRGEGSVRQIPV
jgi:hypothetical protein